jgi:hypothetical protein
MAGDVEDAKPNDLVGTGSGLDIWYKVSPELVDYVRSAVRKGVRRNCGQGQVFDRNTKRCRLCKGRTKTGKTGNCMTYREPV